MRTNVMVGLGLLACVAGGCKSNDKAQQAGVTGAKKTDPTPAAAAQGAPAKPATPDKKGPAVTAESVKAEALALLTAWTKAQNDGDAAGYFAMYQEKHFKGIKRTTRGAVKKYDFAGWKTDRTKMFVNKPTVASEEAEVKTWLDPGEKLKPGVSIIRFTQRWKTARYADHGIKALHVWRDPAKGQRIIYEDLLNAEPGWDDAPEAGVEELTVAAFKDDAEALALWRKLAPTGADYPEKLASLPDEPAVTRAMARALLAGGNFECDKKIEYDECGEEYSEWEPLDPKSNFDDPCLRRRLAIWAVEDAELTEEDVNAVAVELEKLLALDKPEEELPEAVMTLAGKTSEKTRMRFIVEAIEADRRDLAESSLNGLSDAALVELTRAHHLDAAVKELANNLTVHRATLLAALADDRLDVDTRRELMNAFDGVTAEGLNAALATVADDDDCALAMEAAVELASRGDASRLPKKPANTDVQAHARALCMLMHDPDGARQSARLSEFLPPKGGAIVDEETDDPYSDQFEGEEGEPAEPEEPEETKITRTDSLREHLDDSFGEKEPSCGGPECRVEAYFGTFTVTFDVGKDGKLYIARIHTYRWMGCGC